MNRSIPTPSARCRRFAGRLGVVAATSALVAAGTFAQPVLAETAEAPPPHGHRLVLGVEFGPEGPTWRKCVDIAAGQDLPVHVHHDHFHAGTAGDALREAGNFPMPTAPLRPWKNCAEFEAIMGR